jgi:hypothetical protein
VRAAIARLKDAAPAATAAVKAAIAERAKGVSYAALAKRPIGKRGVIHLGKADRLTLITGKGRRGSFEGQPVRVTVRGRALPPYNIPETQFMSLVQPYISIADARLIAPDLDMRQSSLADVFVIYLTIFNDGAP